MIMVLRIQGMRMLMDWLVLLVHHQHQHQHQHQHDHLRGIAAGCRMSSMLDDAEEE